MDTHQDLAEMIREAHTEETAAYVKAILTDCCDNGGADKATIWGLLSDVEKQKYKELLSANCPVDISISPTPKKLIKPSTQTSVMHSQNCITELLTGKRWHRTMLIATKQELEVALGSLGSGSDRAKAVQETLERFYPEKRSKFPVKKKVII